MLDLTPTELLTTTRAVRKRLDLERPVERGQHAVPLGVTFYTYRESVFIFAAKASVYLRALGYELPKLVRGFVG